MSWWLRTDRAAVVGLSQLAQNVEQPVSLLPLVNKVLPGKHHIGAAGLRIQKDSIIFNRGATAEIVGAATEGCISPEGLHVGSHESLGQGLVWCGWKFNFEESNLRQSLGRWWRQCSHPDPLLSPTLHHRDKKWERQTEKNGCWYTGSWAPFARFQLTQRTVVALLA